MTASSKPPTPQDISAKSLVQLRFFDPDGAELDTVIIYKSGNSSGIPRQAAWVEVTYPADPAPPQEG